MDREIESLLTADETVIRIVRRHPVNLAPVVSSVVIIIIALLGMAYLAGRNGTELAKYIPPNIVNLALFVVLILTFFIMLAALRIYRRNCLVLTNHCLMQIQQFGLFNHTVSKLSLANVEDVSSRRNGVLATILDYGDVVVESAGEQENFVFAQAANPSTLVEAINRAHTGVVENRRTIREQTPVGSPRAMNPTDPTGKQGPLQPPL
jgi:hypothetical protein